MPQPHDSRPALSDQTPTSEAPAAPTPPGALVESLCADQERRWRSGQRILVEEYLARHPELRSDAGRLLDLMYNEACLREEVGEQPTLEEYLRRFPEHDAELRVQWMVHRVMDIPLPDVGPETTTLPPSAPAASARASGMPATIGKYRLVERLGKGAQGEVFRAFHPELGRDVVVKWAAATLGATAQQALVREGRVLAQLDDPGVARVFDVDVHEGRPFVVFEHVAGRSLAEVVKQKPLSAREAAALVAEVAAVLERVHQKGVLHRDLKPSNILIDAAGRPRLLDFGLACLEQRWTTINPPTENVTGTLHYMPPEQAQGDIERMGPRSDVFSLGAVLYELLVGQPPHQTGDVLRLWALAREGKVKPLRELDSAIPPALERVCMKALAAEPEQRYGSAAELAAALRTWLRRPWQVAVGAAAAFLITAVALVGYAAGGLNSPKSPRVPAVEKPLAGELSVQVWTKDRHKRGFKVEEDGSGALPVRNRDEVQLVVKLNQAAHVYLIWLDADGDATPLYPWNDKDRDDDLQNKLSSPLPSRPARQEVRSPRGEGQGFPVEGRSGLVAALLLARRAPLPASVELDKLLAEMKEKWKKAPPPGEFEVVVRGFDRGELNEAVSLDRNRGLGTATDINDAVLQLRDRLSAHFELIRSVSFAQVGDE